MCECMFIHSHRQAQRLVNGKPDNSPAMHHTLSRRGGATNSYLQVNLQLTLCVVHVYAALNLRVSPWQLPCFTSGVLGMLPLHWPCPGARAHAAAAAADTRLQDSMHMGELMHIVTHAHMISCMWAHPMAVPCTWMHASPGCNTI